MKRVLITLLILCNYSLAALADKPKKEDFLDIDTMAQRLGPMKDLRLETIVDTLKAGCSTELEILRAFYYWETHAVAFDCKAYHNPDRNSATASAALMSRKATSEGFANLYKAMCDIAHIKCEVVAGVYRRDADDIGNFNESARQYWNIVESDGTKFVVDASLGAGTTDAKVKNFTPEYTDAWWLSTRTLFALTHFPDSAKHQLLQIPVTKQEFTSSPVVAGYAIVMNISPFKTMKGELHGREDTSASLVFSVLKPESINKASAAYDDMPAREIPAMLEENKLTLKVPYGNAGNRVIYLFVNNKLCYIFKADVRPAPKKKK